MPKYALQRILTSIPLLLGVTIIIFMITRILPGDPARTIAGPIATAEEVERIRESFGLNEPLLHQYIVYLRDLLQGNLGISLRTRGPVSWEILSRLPNTLTLIFIGLLAATLLGIPMGVLAATKRYTVVDYVTTLFSLFGLSMPVFWSGLLLIFFFAVILQWLPAGGYGTAKHYILPSLTLTLYNLANIMRLTRSSMLEVLGQDYIQTAHSKGLKKRIVIYRHGLRNAMIPIFTLIGLQFGALLGGTVLTETVFAWPGIGRLMVQSIFARDYTVLQSTILIFAMIIICINLLVDLSYTLINPKIRYG